MGALESGQLLNVSDAVGFDCATANQMIQAAHTLMLGRIAQPNRLVACQFAPLEPAFGKTAINLIVFALCPQFFLHRNGDERSQNDPEKKDVGRVTPNDRAIAAFIRLAGTIKYRIARR